MVKFHFITITKKLDTTATGIDVNGTVTATEFDGLLETGTAFKVGANDSSDSVNDYIFLTVLIVS